MDTQVCVRVVTLGCGKEEMKRKTIGRQDRVSSYGSITRREM